MKASLDIVRIILAEDSLLLREGLTRLLAEAGHEVCAAVDSAPDLVAAVAADRPDLVITDVRMPPNNTDDGLRAAVELRRTDPTLPILVLSAFVERAYARELFATGAPGIGYLLKDRLGDLERLEDAITRVCSGDTVVDPEVVAQMLVHSPVSPLQGLTAREQQVLALLAQGLSNMAIGKHLFLSAGTVEKHISAIFAKLGLSEDAETHRRVQAVLAYLSAESEVNRPLG